MKWFVGLGNPGRQYELTRHNIGFMAVDAFAERMEVSYQNKFNAHVAEGRILGEKVALIKPMTYMNLSGESVRAFMDFYKVKLEDMIVLYDDLDTEFGQLRLRYKGSAGGHNGIKSIISHVGTQQFNRIRLGISRPPAGWHTADYVLSPFAKNDSETLNQVIQTACEALEYAMEHPFENVMAKFNG